MRRLPGPADRPLCDGVKTPEAPVGLFRGWQRTQTQSSVRTLRSLRQQMDVWFCLMQELSEQESSAERHCCVEADPDQTNCAPSGARLGSLCFSLDFDLHRRGRSGDCSSIHTSYRENDPAAFLHAAPGSFDIGQWHWLYVDMELARSRHPEQFWNRSKDRIKRHRAKPAAKQLEVHAA